MKLNPYLEVVLAALIWGSTGVFVRYLGLSPGALAFFRGAVPAAVLFVYLQASGVRLFQGNWKIMMAASALNALRIYLYFVGFSHTSIGNATILVYTWPLFATVYGALWLGEGMSWRKGGMLGLAFAGLALVFCNREFSFSDADFLGMVAILAHSAIYALTFVIFKRQLDNYSRWETIFYQNLALVLFLPCLFLPGPFPDLSQISLACVYGVLIGVVGFGLFFSALARIDAFSASALSYLEIVSSVIFGMVFFSEPLTWNMAAGGALIVASTLWLKLPRERRPLRRGTD